MTAEELANKELEKLKKINRGITYPIDPFKILKDAGVFIVLKDFENLDGIIINDDDNCNIVGININNNWQRQRFTAAHEYCHYLKDLQRENGTTNIIQCLKNSNLKIEKYANDFAGYLLMPTGELKKICSQYKNPDGFIDLEKVTIIAEYFGVSFSSCLNRIAYGLNLIKGDISPDSLKKMCKDYNPLKKRVKLFDTGIDNILLSNVISSMSYIITNLNNYTGQKFLQNYIYNDNKLEGILIDRKKLNYILADLNYNKEKSNFFNCNSKNVVMTLGNLELQKYVITTNDKVSFKKCKFMHSLLYKYVPFSEENGKYRQEMAIMQQATIQPTLYINIQCEIDKLDEQLQEFLLNIDKYNIGEYIKKAVYFTYKFVTIHPFRDGNGRISRAFLNWLLINKRISPIYIDKNCKNEYYDALSQMDLYNNLTPFVVLIEKRIIHTLMETHKYLFVDEIEENENNTDLECIIEK